MGAWVGYVIERRVGDDDERGALELGWAGLVRGWGGVGGRGAGGSRGLPLSEGGCAFDGVAGLSATASSTLPVRFLAVASSLLFRAYIL